MDNKSEKVESTNAANRLIQRDQVALIIGALSSSPTMAAAPVAEHAGVPLVSGWATNPLVHPEKEVHLPHLLHRSLPGLGGRPFRL